MEILLFVLPWIVATYLLAEGGDPDLSWLRRLLESLRSAIVVAALLGLVGSTIFGVCVWFNGFYGYELSGFYRVVFGLALWPMPLLLVFYAVQRIRT